MRYLFVLIYSCMILTSKGQEKDYAAELTQKLVNAYYTSYPLTYTFDMHQYDSSGKVFIESMKGEITASTKYYHMNYGNMEVIIADSFMLTRNSEVKEIILKLIRPSQRDSLLGLGINAIIERMKSEKIVIKKLNTNDKTTVYELYFEYLDEGVSLMKLDNKTGYIQELDVKYYAGDDRFRITPYTMKIYYSNYRPTKVSNPMKKYLKWSDNNMSLTDQYKEFKLIRF